MTPIIHLPSSGSQGVDPSRGAVSSHASTQTDTHMNPFIIPTTNCMSLDYGRKLESDQAKHHDYLLNGAKL